VKSAAALEWGLIRADATAELRRDVTGRGSYPGDRRHTGSLDTGTPWPAPGQVGSASALASSLAGFSHPSQKTCIPGLLQNMRVFQTKHSPHSSADCRDPLEIS
jgi:hypothetical protein